MSLKASNNVILKFTKFIYYCQIPLGTSRVVFKSGEMRPISIFNPTFWISFLSPFVCFGYILITGSVTISKNILFAMLLTGIPLMVNVIYTRKLSVKLYKLCQEISNSCQEITKSSYVMKINWIMCGIVLIILLNLIPELINVIYNCYNWKTGMEWIFMLVEVYRKMIRPLIWDLDLMLWIHFCNILRMNVQSINNLLGEKYLKKAIGKTCKTKCSIIVAEKNSEPEKETLKKCIYVFERTNYAFTLLKRIHKYSIFTFCAKTFIIGLFRFREILLNILSDSKIISHGIDWELILFKNVRNLFIIALLSTTAELYCKELDDTRKIASQIMDYTKEKTQVYDVVKTILWLIEETPPDFVFFGFFKLDGTLPFKYITQYLTYAVILIQFTFL